MTVPHRSAWPLATVLTTSLVLAPLGASAQPTAEEAPADESPPPQQTEASTPAPVPPPPPTEVAPPDPETEETSPEVAAPPPAAAPPPPAPSAPPSLELGPITLVPSLQVWSRGEVRTNDYVVPNENLHFVLQRARFGLAASVGVATAVVQVQDVRNFGQSAPGTDVSTPDGFGLHQGYVEVRATDIGYLRAGRQEVNYGTQRMIGALDWTAPARSFDGLRLHGAFGKLTVDVVGAYLAPRVLPNAATMTPGSPGQFLVTGMIGYAAHTALNAELYYLSRHDATNDTHVFSPGVRLFGSPARGFVYDAEAYVQAGERAGSDHFAYAVAGDVTYRTSGAAGFGVDAGASIGSGPTVDGDVDEFENFFPTNHKFYGFMDLFGLRNMMEGHAGVSLRPRDTNLDVGLRGFLFGHQRASGRWTNAGGAVIGAAGANTTGDRFAGFEADLFASYRPASYLTLLGGYSVFVPGESAEAFGRDETQHWAWLQLIVATP